MMRCFILTVALGLVSFADPVDSALQTSNTLKIGDERPELNFALLDGRKGPTWHDLEGQVVVIDFWATWCAPCVASFPRLNALQAKFRGQPIRFYSITYEPAAKVSALLRDHPLRTTVGIDNDLATFKAFRAWGVPSVYIFDREGTVVSAIQAEDLTEAVVRDVLAGRIPQVKQNKGWDDPKGAEEYFRSTLKSEEPAVSSKKQ